MGTVPTNIHTEIETQYTIPVHSQFWRPGDVGTLPTDTQYTNTTYSHFRDIHRGTEKKILKFFFNIHGHGGHLGHVRQI